LVGGGVGVLGVVCGGCYGGEWGGGGGGGSGGGGGASLWCVGVGVLGVGGGGGARRAAVHGVNPCENV